jgi:hypothetical protein
MAEVIKYKRFVPYKIVSGGQTGVDRAGLDAAIACKIRVGGYMPKNALAEDGRVPAKYNLKETKSPEYAQRTILNIITSHATLILYNGKLDGGTLLTYEVCSKKKKPVLTVNLEYSKSRCKREIYKFLNEVKPRTLNIAGPRESKSPGIYKKVYKLLVGIFVKNKKSL